MFCLLFHPKHACILIKSPPFNSGRSYSGIYTPCHTFFVPVPQLCTTSEWFNPRRFCLLCSRRSRTRGVGMRLAWWRWTPGARWSSSSSCPRPSPRWEPNTTSRSSSTRTRWRAPTWPRWGAQCYQNRTPKLWKAFVRRHAAWTNKCRHQSFKVW